MTDISETVPSKAGHSSIIEISRPWAGHTFSRLEAGFLTVIIVALVMRLWDWAAAQSIMMRPSTCTMPGG